MQITRRFVPEGTDPYSLFKYVQHQCLIKHHVTGKVQCDYTAEVPEHWSTNARNIAISKYFRKGGVPSILTSVKDEDISHWLWRCVPAPEAVLGGEISIKSVVHRIVGHWTYTGLKAGYFDVKSARAFYDENVYILLKQMAAPNSPQWFNTGLYWAYGITGPSQGHWYVDLTHNTSKLRENLELEALYPLRDISTWNKKLEVYATRSNNAYERVQAHACFILTLDDTMFNGETGIFEWYNAEGLIFKYGSGSGVNASNLRGEGESLSGGGKSSGMMSWLKVCDYSAGAIKSGGTTRRAAKMVCLDADHPDIDAFIDCKVKAEVAAASLIVGSNAIAALCQQIIDKVRGHAALYNDAAPPEDVLMAMKDAHLSGIPHNYIKKAERMALLGYDKWIVDGYDNEYEGEAYSTVPFQNANHSVRLTQEFYNKCDTNSQWNTKYRTTGEVKESRPARDLEWKIASAAWFCGDPGVQYHTNINDWNVTPMDGEIRASNPCSEHMRLDDSACNLASLRLMACLKDDGAFDISAYKHVVELYQMILDITVTMSHLPTKRVAMNVFNYRDTGLGYCDLGALIMAMGLAYDSDAGRALASGMTAVLQGVCHQTSAQMAKELGAYPRFHANRDHHLRCVHNHIEVTHGHAGLLDGLYNLPPRVKWEALDAVYTGLGSELKRIALDAFANSLRMAEETGYRNAEMTVLAPTGTISLIMDCDTTGVEPMLGLEVMKTLAGGGSMVLQPARSVELGLRKMGRVGGGQIQTANDIIKSFPSILSETEQEVFNTSFPHPRTGKSIAWQAHIKMMAAVQPFLSGAISKTINMPADATIQDIKDAYRMGNELGLKSLAVYRDGCKLSQPLNIPGLGEDEEVEEIKEVPVNDALSPSIPTGGRMLLGWQRNPGIDIKVGLGGGNLYLRTTRYPDGKCAEIWATYSADQGIIMALLGGVMKTANIALQWGVPLEDIVRSWHDTSFTPNGIVGDHPYIKHATSVLNIIAKLLDYHELGNTSALNIQPNAQLSKADTKAVTEVMKRDLSDFDKVKVTGETCPNCGSQQYIVSGANCKKCLQCGTAGGCG